MIVVEAAPLKETPEFRLLAITSAPTVVEIVFERCTPSPWLPIGELPSDATPILFLGQMRFPSEFSIENSCPAVARNKLVFHAAGQADLVVV